MRQQPPPGATPRILHIAVDGACSEGIFLSFRCRRWQSKEKRRQMIRKYDMADLSELLDVWHDAAQVAHPFWTHDFLEQERSEISRKFLPIAETWVFEREGRVVGFIALLDNEVGGLFVAPAHQRQGIGRALMDHAGESRDHLELEVFEDNKTGRGFYNAYGFTTVGGRLDEETGLRLLRLRLDC